MLYLKVKSTLRVKMNLQKILRNLMLVLALTEGRYYRPQKWRQESVRPDTPKGQSKPVGGMITFAELFKQINIAQQKVNDSRSVLSKMIRITSQYKH